MRDEPAGLVGVILDGVYPPELDADAGLAFSAARALDELDAVCAADATCRRYLSDGSVKATLERVMAELCKNTDSTAKRKESEKKRKATHA